MESNMELNLPVLACCVPKCGTHLLGPILKNMVGVDFIYPDGEKVARILDISDFRSKPKLENKIYITHPSYDDNLREYFSEIPKIILIRDPRDYVISQAHFIDKLKATSTTLNQKFKALEQWDDKLSAVIFGMREKDEILTSVYEMFLSYAIKWFSSSKSIIVRFEELVRIRSNSEPDKILDTLRRISGFLGFRYSDNYLLNQAYHSADPKDSLTYRSGKTGSWRDEFKPQHVIQIKLSSPQLISTLGYEDDEDWQLARTLGGYKEIDTQRALNLPFIPPQFDDTYQKLRLQPNTSPGVLHILDLWYLKNSADSGNFEKALGVIDNLLARDPTNAEWNYLKAFCLHNLHKDLEKALQHYGIALSNGFDEFWTRFNRGSLLMDMGKLSSSLEDLEKASQINPSHEWTRNKIEQIRNNLQNKEK